MPGCAVLFAKNPEPGKVKTRLQPHCSPQQAAALYQAFALDSGALLGQCAAERKVVAYAPAGAEQVLRTLLGEVGDFEYLAQPDGDLGGRMEAVMQWSFAAGCERTVILGSDSPSLPAAYVDRALELLREREVVLGPSADGGYYLVGRRRGESRIFQDVAWSTGRVLEQTLERLGEQSLGLLPPWYDVDTAAEAAFLRAHLEALVRSGERPLRCLQVLRGLELPPPS